MFNLREIKERFTVKSSTVYRSKALIGMMLVSGQIILFITQGRIPKH